MNIDNFNDFKLLDKQNMLSEINDLPDQVARAFSQGMGLPLPKISSVRQVVVSGMGGSAIGADLLSSYINPMALIPITVHRDYGLPKWAHGDDVLVIASSHSGNTEETLDSFETALHNKCQVFAICTGGELANRVRENKVPFWIFNHKGQPRAAIGYSFGLLLALFDRIGLISPQSETVVEATRVMTHLQENLHADVLTIRNPAKQFANKLLNRWVTVIGPEFLAPVARRYKGQINEIAKAGANFESLPEANHNALAGLLNPSQILKASTATIILSSKSVSPRNRLRANLTKDNILAEGLNVDLIEAHGETPLAQIWSLILFGDYLAYYLAMSYDVDPTPIDTLEKFKKSMKAAILS